MKIAKIATTTLLLAALSTISLAAEESSRDHQSLARDIFAKVVAMDTSITGKRTPDMAAYLAGLFRDAGFANDDVIEVPISPTQTSLLVRYRGRDEHAKGVGFMAHMDVVTALRKDWVLDPFALVEQDGYFIGRGTSDNKAGIVGLTATFLKLKKSGFVPQRNMLLIFTSDEETGMIAARHMSNQLRDTINIEYAINADGLSGVLTPEGKLFGYYVQGAEKSPRTVELTVRNPGGHSSAPRADNAIYQLATALTKIENFSFPVAINEISTGMLQFAAKRSDSTTATAIEKLLADPTDTAAAAALSTNPMIATVIRTTCVATMLNAGHASNALPQSATATVNCRIMPGVDPAAIYKTLDEVIDDNRVELRPLQEESAIATASPMRKDVMTAIKYAVSESHPDVELIPFMASYATDGMHFRAAGIPVYGSSGTFMDPGQSFAHGLNEKIPVKSFYDSLRYWERLITHIGAQTAAK